MDPFGGISRFHWNAKVASPGPKGLPVLLRFVIEKSPRERKRSANGAI
jgi:hypothetical protein